MAEYYKLTRYVAHGRSDVNIEEIYLEINGDKSAVMTHIPEEKKLLNTKLEKISEEDAVEALHRSQGNFEEEFNFR